MQEEDERGEINDLSKAEGNEERMEDGHGGGCGFIRREWGLGRGVFAAQGGGDGCARSIVESRDALVQASTEGSSECHAYMSSSLRRIAFHAPR